MKYAHKFSLVVFVILIGILSFDVAYAQNKTDEIQTVNLCDLIRNPTPFNNKIVRVKGTYRYGIEWSELYCSDCWDSYHRIDVVADKKSFDKKLKSSVRKRFSWGNDSITMNVTFVGRFVNLDTNNNPTNPYKFFKLIVSEVEKAKILAYVSYVPTELEEKIREKTFCKNP